MPCLPAISGVVTRRVGGLWPFATPLDTPRRTPFSLEMNHLRCEDIVEATLVAAVAVVAEAAAAASAYGMGAKIAHLPFKFSFFSLRAKERESVFVGMVAT
jgi:hypothetical protein